MTGKIERTKMSESFFENPILNSPYDEPTKYHALDELGQPTDQQPIKGRRRSDFVTPVPKSKTKRTQSAQTELGLSNKPDVSTENQDYDASRLINEIRSHVANWRRLPNPSDWSVSPTTAKLLRHWREKDNFQGIRPFFCQVEAVETIIWLTEVAPKQRAYKWIWDQLKSTNKEANPELIRLAMKMATGAGKTTVMAMIIA